MLKYNMYEAKTRLSENVKKVREGEEVILMNRSKRNVSIKMRQSQSIITEQLT